ncbi:hypothetical protein ACFOWE_18045 [Planomonospora corallina]|uniref:DUF488 domain-containing protein n=1 Tax=Planomonospora corallina TaxID=1806052 RepID=A0ABV8IEE7_9ACTN
MSTPEPAPAPGLRLATCTYQEFLPPMGHPVRTTVGMPRFQLAYSLAGHATRITPKPWFLGKPLDAYTLLYRRHLEESGVDAIAAELAEIATRHEAGRPLVLLCFDRLTTADAWCHRSMFATWWQEKTGQDVPELGALPPISPPSLF